ncbi:MULTISPECIES: helix-turn-helix domain-containing protein [unclassified Streptomyces]|uniref:MarR family transcriptional regulator n=1 Tax=unclassified Streptomyces TaxID=2593676 RepID=UPI0003A2FC7B|nr:MULTISPECIES: helix-turn-helix domain-containing protein [unclassified Streptomyces]MYT32669.1 helix-turn-helix domain-containing protein [Streptomyces sp. SID8354]
MSDTNLDATTTRSETPPAPLTGLTGAAAAVYTQLMGMTEPATVAELAHAAGIGHSTAGRAVTTLEKRGLAARTRGGHDGPRRMPDLWHPVTPTPNPETTNTPEHTEQPSDAQPESTPTGSAGPVNNDSERGEETSEDRAVSSASAAPAPTSPNPTITVDAHLPADTSLDAPDAPAAGETEAHTELESDTLHGDAPGDTEHSNGDNSKEDSPQSEEDDAPTPSEGTEAQTAPAQPTPAKDGRLAPGALRQMVIDHLHAHPAEAFTATRISRVIERSSGAIANALVKLVGSGIAEQITDQPRTYRLTQTARTPNIS